MELIRVLKRSDGVKYCVIPKHSDINAGEKIVVSNNLKLINKFLEEENGREK